MSLNCLLYDFGCREAAPRNANALLDAARATQDATLQSFFTQAAKDYYVIQTTDGELKVAQDVEAMTRESIAAAQSRAEKGVAPITDALQAQTQHEAALAKGPAQHQPRTEVQPH